MIRVFVDTLKYFGNDVQVKTGTHTGILDATKLDSANNAALSIADIAGKVVYEETINMLNGVNSRYVDVSRLVKGTYILSVSTAEDHAVGKLMCE